MIHTLQSLLGGHTLRTSSEFQFLGETLDMKDAHSVPGQLCARPAVCQLCPVLRVMKRCSRAAVTDGFVS